MVLEFIGGSNVSLNISYCDFFFIHIPVLFRKQALTRNFRID